MPSSDANAVFIIEVLLRGVALGGLAATGAAIGRSAPGRDVRIAGALFCASAAAYVLNSAEFDQALFGPALGAAIHVMALAGAALFWLFVVCVFEDRRLSLETFGPALGLTALGLVAIGLGDPRNQLVWMGHNLIESGFAAHALWVIWRSWRGDLVAARRALRGPFLMAVTGLVMTLSVFEIIYDFGIRAWWYDLADAAALAAYCTAGAVIFLQARADLFGAGAKPQPRPPVPQPGAGSADLDAPALARLEAVMGAGEAWRQEGLTIAGLAAKVALPEHRLRALINDRLGHRNFAAFVNTRRIEAAKAALADPASARQTIAAIAFDLGFASLGPFNRAFKDATGLTPTQWRAQSLAGGSPKPENPA